MEGRLSCSVSVHEEDLEGKKVFVAECPELGISDFGDTLDEALLHLREAIQLVLEKAPEKKALLLKNEPVFVTQLVL